MSSEALFRCENYFHIGAYAECVEAANACAEARGTDAVRRDVFAARSRTAMGQGAVRGEVDATATATARHEACDARGRARARGMIGMIEMIEMMMTTDGDARRAARADRGVRGVGRRALGDASGENLRDV
jgi:hypothetical protein